MRARKRPSPVQDAFDRVAAHVEDASRALVAAMPSARRAGAPLAEALLAFESSLSAAREVMPAWRTEATEATWSACANALEDASAKAERLRLSGMTLDFEGMAMVLGDLVAALDAFQEAERAVRGLV